MSGFADRQAALDAMQAIADAVVEIVGEGIEVAYCNAFSSNMNVYTGDAAMSFHIAGVKDLSRIAVLVYATSYADRLWERRVVFCKNLSNRPCAILHVDYKQQLLMQAIAGVVVGLIAESKGT